MMSPIARRLFRLMLHAYPKEFRRSYGDAMLQTVIDRHGHDGLSWSRLVAREFFDATRVAPLMRWESPMNRIVLVVLVAAGAALAAIAFSPVVLIPLAVIMIAAVVWWSRHDRPIESNALAHRWHWWLVAGLATIAIGVAIPAIDGGELDGGWWAVFALALLAGTAMTLAGIIGALNGPTRPSQHPAHSAIER